MPNNKNYKIIKNFLPEDVFKNIQKILMSADFPYYYGSRVASEEDTGRFYFTHHLFEDYIVSRYFDLIRPILEKLNVFALRRAKVNFFTRDSQFIKHTDHYDYPEPHNGAVFSINTCNGGTFIGEDFIQSEENSIILFDSSILHSSSNCTDQHARININLNWR
jgi:hypothetical protein